MSDCLPTDILIQIFLRLPFKSIVLCSCVCKSWQTVITSQIFVTTHLKHNGLNNEHHHHQYSPDDSGDLLLLRHCNDNTKKENFSIYRNNEAFEVYNQDLECPVQAFGNNYFRIVGSCKGLVCLSDDLFDISGSIYLWNPSIRKAIAIPTPRFLYTESGIRGYVLGFGYDDCSNNFKVVRIAHGVIFEHDSFIPKVEIYTLGTQSWRDISSIAPSHYFAVSKDSWTHAFLNGVVHWVAYDWKRDQNIVCSFDLRDEVFGSIDFPRGIEGRLFWKFRINAANGFLYLFHVDYHQIYMEKSVYSIWVMREYGVVKSWTRLVDIILGGGWGKILCTNESNALMVTGFGKLVLFTGQGRVTLPIQGSKDSFHVEKYVESLFLLNYKVSAVVGNDGVDDAASHEGVEAEFKQHHDRPPIKFTYSRRSRKN